MGRKKSVLCRLGIHDTARETIGTNVGTEQTPIYMTQTYLVCGRCGHREVTL